jgi:endonuclease I
MKVSLLLLFLGFLGIIRGQVPGYYSDVNLELTGESLKIELAEKISENITYLAYSSTSYTTWDALKDGDKNPLDPNEVLLIYGWEEGTDAIPSNDRSRNANENGGNPGQWNREHVFARSLALPPLTVDDPGPGTDILNLRACDMQTNQARSNLAFTSGSGNAAQIGSAWYPGDEWKGDVARIILYMYLQYDGNGTSEAETRCLPSLAGTGPSIDSDPDLPVLFLEWNADDPVSDLEIQKNAIAELYQGNRNPFVDNPALATLIWGGPEAEDTWGLTDQQHEYLPETEVYGNGVLLSWNAPDGAVGCQIRGGYLGGNDPKSINVINQNPQFLFVPAGQLGSGGNFQWKVRCATGINPVQGLTDYSEYDTFFFSGPTPDSTAPLFPTAPDSETSWSD